LNNRLLPGTSFLGKRASALGSSFADFQLLYDLRSGAILSTKRGNSRGVHEHSWPAKPLPFCTCVPYARPNPLLNESALKLGHGSDNLKHETA